MNACTKPINVQMTNDKYLLNEGRPSTPAEPRLKHFNNCYQTKEINSDSQLQMSPLRQNPVLTMPRSLMLDLNYSAFCTEETITQCISYINQEVASLGLSEQSVEPCEGGKGLQAVSTLNLLHQLLQVDRRCLNAMDDLQVQLLRSGSDLEHLRHSHTRLKDHVEYTRRENAKLLESERQLLLKIQTLQSCLKSEKEEVQKLQRIISSRATQYNHSAKKMERECTKLKERLNRMLVDKSEKKLAIEVSSTMERPDGKRSLWKTDRGENRCEGEMYSVVLEDYEARQKSLMVDNVEMRKVLQQMKEDMVSILSSETSVATGGVPENSLEPVSLETEDEDEEEACASSRDNLEQSCEQAREQLTGSIRQHWRRLKNRMQRLDSQVLLAAGEECKQEGEEVTSEQAHEEEEEEELERTRQKLMKECMDHTEQLSPGRHRRRRQKRRAFEDDRATLFPEQNKNVTSEWATPSSSGALGENDEDDWTPATSIFL